jgi:hypothetical protein
MCLLALFFRVLEDAPVVVGANREEAYARGGEPPHRLNGPRPAVAGTDPRAGGTWLGVNARGVLVAVTNRPKSSPPRQPRSRGLLARDLLGCASAREAAERATKELDQGLYAGCNLLCADQSHAVVLHAGDWLRVRPLPPGLHVLTARDVNDAEDPRIAYSLGQLGGRGYQESSDCITALRALCAKSGPDGPAICLHGEQGGTVSSSIIALARPLASSIYLHAQGPPDRSPYENYSHLLSALFVGPGGRE